MSALALAREMQDYMVRIRRQLHESPEVGLDLPATGDLVRHELEALGLEVETDSASSGLTAVLPGTTGQTVILRADMDALPLEERTDEEFRSRNPGAMHACGHDMHTAMLLGAARVLANQPERHEVVLAFQAGEEFDRGAIPLLQHRDLAERDSARAFALHMHAQRPTGAFLSRAGSFMGFGDWFEITITGASGHASSPQLARSPIPAAAFLARAIDDMTDLSEEPWPTRVATVTQVTSGNSVNVIPDAALLRGTIRGRDEATIVGLRAGLAESVQEAEARYHVQVSLSLREGYPAVINDAPMADFALLLAQSQAGGHTLPMPVPSMVIEDFSYFLQRWPGAMAYLGAAVPGHSAFNHSAEVVFDEAAMTAGCAFHIAAATTDYP